MKNNFDFAKQLNFDVCFDWGLAGLAELSSTCEYTIIVDVLSFTTTTTLATAQGATVYPYLYKNETAQASLFAG